MNAKSSWRDLGLIYAAAWLRSFGIGLLGVILGIFLYRRGLSSIAIGAVLAAGIAGSAAGTIFVTFKADSVGRRRTLCCLSLLTALGSVAVIFNLSLPILLAVTFFGMLNGMGTDRSAAYALEQALIPSLVPDERRTWSLAWYSLVLDASGALGALAAALPLMMQTAPRHGPERRIPLYLRGIRSNQPGERRTLSACCLPKWSTRA